MKAAALCHPQLVKATTVRAASEVTLQAYMVGPSGVLRKALFSRGVAARLVAVRGLLYMIIQQLRTMDEGEAEDAMEADPEFSCSQVHFTDAKLLCLDLEPSKTSPQCRNAFLQSPGVSEIRIPM